MGMAVVEIMILDTPTGVRQMCMPMCGKEVWTEVRVAVDEVAVAMITTGNVRETSECFTTCRGGTWSSVVSVVVLLVVVEGKGGRWSSEVSGASYLSCY